MLLWLSLHLYGISVERINKMQTLMENFKEKGGPFECDADIMTFFLEYVENVICPHIKQQDERIAELEMDSDVQL